MWATPPNRSALKSYLGDLPQSWSNDPQTFYQPVEQLAPRHSDIMSRQFPSLVDFVSSNRLSIQKLNICLTTYDLPDSNPRGGWSAECPNVAKLFKDAGHDVTILYMRGAHFRKAEITRWTAFYQQQGITLIALPPAAVPAQASLLPMVRPEAAYQWLKAQSFDMIHGSLEHGGLFPSLTAKHLGMAFEKTSIIVHAWPPAMWQCVAYSTPFASLRDIAISYMERKSIELADAVISPSRYMLRWMMRHGYNPPKENCFIHPFGLASRPSHEEQPSVICKISEIVFLDFGEPRQGIVTFIRAAKLASDALQRTRIVLACPADRQMSVHQLAQHNVGSLDIHVAAYERNDHLVKYMDRDDRLIVMPMLTDGTPELFNRFLYGSVPILVSSVSGAHEAIHVEDRPSVVCDYVPSEMADRLRTIVRDGAHVARPTIAEEDLYKAWLGAPSALYHLGTAGPPDAISSSDIGRSRTEKQGPLVSVCIAHFNRPNMLSQAVDSIRRQTYKNIEIIVVDDGSTNEAAKRYLAALNQQLVAERCGRVIRQKNRYLGAVRNRGTQSSRGDFILHMDDDDVAKPHEIETFLRAAKYSGADILGCYADTFSGPEAPAEENRYKTRLMALGDCVSLALYANCLGGSHTFVRRRVFESLGGHTEDYGVGLDDYEFSLRAVLRGFKLMIVPEPLYHYRYSSTRLRDLHIDSKSGFDRTFNALLDNVPICLYDGLRFAGELYRRDHTSYAPFNSFRNWISERRDIRTIRKSGLFDAAFYLAANPDVAQAGVDPIVHFVRHGAKEGRKPNASFDALDYVSDFPEVAAAKVNPFAHALISGRFSGPLPEQKLLHHSTKG